MTIIFYLLTAFFIMLEIFKIGNSDLLYHESKILHEKQKAYHRNLKRREISPLMRSYMTVDTLYILYIILGLFSTQSLLFAIFFLLKCMNRKSFLLSGIIGLFMLVLIFFNKFVFKINLGW